MKRLIKYVFVSAIILLVGNIITSCRGNSAKEGAKLIEKASKAIKKNASHADDVYRMGKTLTSSASVCTACNGKGTSSYHACHICGGDGYFLDELCLTCNGTGRTNKCSKCNGSGKVSSDN